MLDNNGVCAAYHETARYLAFIHAPGFGIGYGLQVNTLVVDCHLRIDGVLLFAVMPADHTFLHGPGQPPFVRLEATGNQLLLLGERGLGRFVRLFADDFVNLLVEFVDFLLLLLNLLVEGLLFGLELGQHVLLFALVAFEVLLLAFAGRESGLFVVLVGLQEFVLRVYLRLGVLYAAHLFLTEMRELLQVPCAAG